MGWTMVILTALMTALCTLGAVAAYIKWHLRPRLLQDLEELLSRQSDRAAEVLGNRVEEGVRRGVVTGVSSLPTREVLQDTTRNIAKTSIDIVETRLGQIFGRRRSGRENDRSDWDDQK